MPTLEESRTFFADEVRLTAGLRGASVRNAFASVPRERFFGPGPWRIVVPEFSAFPVYADTDDDDPRWLCHNVAIALDESRHLVSGLPSMLARYIDRLGIRPGERVLHIGSGVGYYTAILADITGPSGRVIATEADPSLCRRGRVNLAPYPWVELHEGAGLPEGIEPVDAILMNAGLTHIEPAWLDLLREGGRMLAPIMAAMGPTSGQGIMFEVRHAGGRYSAHPILPTLGYAAVGLRDPAMEPLLSKAFSNGDVMKIRVLRREPHTPGPGCVVHREGSCLARAA